MSDLKQLAKDFMDLFSGLTIAHGKMQLDKGTKESGKQNATHSHVREEVTENTWVDHFNGLSIGIVPIRDDGDTAQFGAIDIDSYQGFSFIKLLTNIEKINLPLIVCRSKSGGAHCYLFLHEPVSAVLLHTQLRQISAAIGYATNHRGELTEIFPKQVKLLLDRGDMGSFINMPYCDVEKPIRFGYILKDNEPVQLSAEEFVRYARSKRVTKQELMEFKLPKHPDFHDGPPCLEIITKNGIDEGGRNVALFAIGVYYRLAFPDSWEQKIEQANMKYLSEPLTSKEVINTVKSVGRKEYAYPCKQAPLCNYCLKSDCIQRKFGVGSDIGEAPQLDSILKIDTDPPIYILNLLDRNGLPIPITLTVDQLLSARKVKLACVQSMNYLPFVPKQNEWEKQVQKVMERMDVVSVPDDSSSSGQLLYHLQTYINKKARSNKKTELLLGKPFYEGDKAYFRMIDFCSYLELNHFRSFKPNEITVIFRRQVDLGLMGHKSINVNNKTVRVWWTSKDSINEELSIPNGIEIEPVF